MMRFIALFALVFAMPLWAQELAKPEPLRTISVRGSDYVEVMADEASFAVTISQKHEDQVEALEEVAERSDAVMAVLQAAGIAETDIETSAVSVSLVYQSENGGFFKKPDSYIATNRLRVTARDFEALTDLLPALTEAGATDIGYLYFDYSDRDALEMEAMIKAVEDAREKAEAIAGKAGMEVLDPIVINYGVEGGSRGNVNYEASPDVPVVLETPSSGQPSKSITIQPNMIREGANVEVTYQIQKAE